MGEVKKAQIKSSKAKIENAVPQKQKKDISSSLSSPVEQILFLQRTIGNQAVVGLIKSVSTVQCKKENEKALGDIQGYAMFALLPELLKLAKEVRTDEEAGIFVGGPRLVVAMHVVRYKDEGKSSSDFVNEHHNELVSLKYEDQIGDVMRFLGAKEKDIKAFVEKYVQSIAVGWKEVKTGYNAQEVRVGNKGQQIGETDDGIRRIPLQIDSSKQAIVLIPAGLNPARSIDVLLHLHGQNVGYQGVSLDTVRDVQKDQIEQQLMASGRKQMIAILPQGSNKSVFQGVNTTTYVGSVFTVLNNLGIWGKDSDEKPILTKTEGHNVILSAHSGGGDLLSNLLDKSGKPTNPGGLEGLFLFDSINALKIPKKNKDGSIAKDKNDKTIMIPDINNSGELKRIRDFVKFQLNLELKQLDDLTKLQNGIPDPDQNQIRQRQLQFLEKSGFRVRGYYSPGWYEQIYDPLVQDIKIWFEKTAATKLPNLDKQVIDRWSNNYVIQSINAVSKVGRVGKGHLGHDYIVGQGIPAGKDGKDYDPGKGGALQDALSSIQPKLFPGGSASEHGADRGADQVIRRQGAPAAAVLTDAQQWDQDWTNYAVKYRYFAGIGRPAGTPRERYDKLCPLYKAHGIPRPMVYLTTSVIGSRFYNFNIEAHNDLITAMAAAEVTLKGKGYIEAPVKNVGALNARTTSAGGWSNHAAGTAVDIDPDDNPFMTSQEERKIITLVTGTDMDKKGQGYDILKGASDRFKADYNPAGLQRRIIELKAAEKALETQVNMARSERDTLNGERDMLRSKRDELRKQLKTVPTGKTATADDVTRANELKTLILQKDADLKQVETQIKQKEVDLKKKEVEFKTATKDRELLEKQLATYQATEQAISDLENAVTSLPTEIKSLEDQINQSKLDEQGEKNAKNLTGVQAQQKLRVKLQQALTQKKASFKNKQTQLNVKKKQREADPLRKYAAGGFLNLSKDVVDAMTGAGLKWGGNWEGAKDFMHFEL
jgi:hypothetical protein